MPHTHTHNSVAHHTDRDKNRTVPYSNTSNLSKSLGKCGPSERTNMYRATGIYLKAARKGGSNKKKKKIIQNTKSLLYFDKLNTITLVKREDGSGTEVRPFEYGTFKLTTH